MKYKTILFDLDGTLLLGEPDLWLLYVQFAQECGLNVLPDAAKRAERFAHYFYAGHNYKSDLERLGTLESFRLFYMTRALQEMQCEGDLESAARTILRRLAETPRRRFVPSDTRDMLSELHARGYTLGLVTNRRADEMAEVYHPYDLEQHFSFVVTSSDVITPKPHRAMFDLALERATCCAAEAMHVGDNYFADVAGAEPLGITPVLVDPKGLFPEATCQVVQQLPQLWAHLA